MNRLKLYWGKISAELSNFTSKNLLDQASRVQKRKANTESSENNRMRQQYNENMVNKTGNSGPDLQQQKEHQPVSAVNHVTQELHETDALKKKLKNIFNGNNQYYIKMELKDRVNQAKAKQKQKK